MRSSRFITWAAYHGKVRRLGLELWPANDLEQIERRLPNGKTGRLILLE